MDNVYYIKVNPYVYNLSINVIVNRFLSSKISNEIGLTKDNQSNFIKYIRDNIVYYKYVYKPKNMEEFEMDKIVTKQLLVLLQEFFEV